MKSKIFAGRMIEYILQVILIDIICSLECGAQRDGRPSKYRWCPLLNAADWLTLTARVPCSNAANTGELKTWTQSEFCTWQTSVTVGGKSPQMYIYSVQAQETAKHHAKFGLPPLSDVDAVLTKPRRETR